MKRQVITADSVSQAKLSGLSELCFPANALVTPAAVDAAREMQIRLCRQPSGAGVPPAQSAVAPSAPASFPVALSASATQSGAADGLPDLRETDLFSSIPVKAPKDPQALARLKSLTPARICLDRAGVRYKTKSLLRFKADHAAAVDAAFTDVAQAFLDGMKLPAFTTLCTTRDEYLRRPDLGRALPPEQLDALRKVTGPSPKVLIYFADGLSSTALETNGPDAYKSLVAGLARHGITPCAPFFVRWCRVPAQDCISEATGAEVVCTLIGERPGLVSAESLSAYFSYKATVGMPEARRTVVSNIHKGGTPAVEAGAYIADIIKRMLELKAGGTDLPL